MDSKWLKLQFKLKPEKSKAALARALNLEPPAVSKILSGTRQIKANEYIQMRKFFGLDSSEVSNDINNKSYVIKTLDGLSENSKQQGDWSIPASILEKKTNAPPEKIKIFLIEEDVMEPDLRKGEYVVVDMSDITPDPAGVFVISDGFGYVVRNCCYKSKASRTKILVSANKEDFEPQALQASDITIAGRVIGIMHWL